MQTVAALMILNNKLEMKLNPSKNVRQHAEKRIKTALNSFMRARKSFAVPKLLQTRWSESTLENLVPS
jgi:hypothetical protein